MEKPKSSGICIHFDLRDLSRFFPPEVDENGMVSFRDKMELKMIEDTSPSKKSGTVQVYVKVKV